jgi:hypothetical protein
MVNTKNELCNLAVSLIGNYGTISDIDSPTNDKERILSQWYDICRRLCLKILIPSFARERQLVAQLETAKDFGYTKAWQLPSNCLRVLGLGNLEDKGRYIYTIEDNKIFTEDAWASGVQVRFIKDVTDVTKMSDEFKMTLAAYLAYRTCMQFTNDSKKRKELKAMLPEEFFTAAGISAQESVPIRKSTSKFKAARNTPVQRNPSRK